MPHTKKTKYKSLGLRCSPTQIIIGFVFVFFIVLTNASICPQACATCTSDGNCTQCISQSHVFLSANFGCLPCSIKCLTCSSQQASNKCQTCSNGYFISIQTSYCTKCQSSNCNSCNPYSPSQCLTCQDGFYLEGATSTCKNCSVYANSLTCRQNVILTCQSGYFSNNGLYCNVCGPNCTTCSNINYCTKCKNGFYLSSSICKSCQTSCLTCIGGSTCSSCSPGYKLNSSSLCSLCSTANCLLCSSQDICSMCSNNYYLDTITKKCILVNLLSQTILKCSQYQGNSSLSSSSQLNCISCNSNFYLNTYFNSCQFCSLLCQTCTNYYRTSHCTSCTSYGLLVDSQNGFCQPKLYSDSNQNIYYLNNRNNIDNYQFYGSIVSSQEGLNNCPGGKLATRLLINFGAQIGYSYKVFLKFIFSTSKTNYVVDVFINEIPISVINFSSMTGSPSNSTSQQNMIMICGSVKVAKSSFVFTNEKNILLNSNNTLKFQIQNNTDLSTFVSLSQLLLVYQQCHPSCQICLTYYQCIQCINTSFFLQNQKCVLTCGAGFFFNNVTQISDLLAISNMSMQNLFNFCSKTCILGTFQSIQTSTWTCQKCDFKCKTCISQSHCLTCNSYYYLFNNSCNSFCPSKFYANSDVNRCQSCAIPCNECTSLKLCSSCQTGFLYKNNFTCLSFCPSGYYADYQTLKCLKCLDPCLTCSNLTNCLSCTISSNLTYYNFLCLSQCPIGFFKFANSDNTIQCKQCVFPCLQCQNSSDICTNCIIGYLLSSNGSCVTICPNQYVSSNTFMKCIACQSPCKSCQISPSYCTSCISGYYLQIDKFICTLKCANGYYLQQSINKCQRCIQNCNTCLSYFNCTTCNDGYYLQGTDCLTECYEGYYSDYQTNACKKCNLNCKTCFGQTDYCTTCNTYYFLQSNNTCSSNCLQTQLFPGCQACQFPCYSCINQTYTCSNCQNQYFLTPQLGQCSSQCYYGYYKIVQNGFGYCIKCKLPCQSCSNPDNCLVCLKQSNGTSYFLQTEGLNHVCKSKCNQYFYSDSNNSLCLPCLSPCLQCISATQCTSCENGVLSGYNCLSLTDGCPIGQFLFLNNLAKVCQNCPSQCTSCTNYSTCTGCNSNYYLFDYQCQNFCPKGYVANIQLHQCLLCQFPCQQCVNTSTYCTKCQQLQLTSDVLCPVQQIDNNTCIRYFLFGGQCLSQCPSIAYPDKKQCVSCPWPCYTCYSELICTSCLKGYYILQSRCYQVCPDGFYIQNKIQICESCPYPCNKCKNETFCIQCGQGYLYNGLCSIIAGCPLGFYQTFNINLSKVCNKCNESCASCFANSNNCLECRNQLSNFQGSCYTICPSGYFSLTKKSQFIDSQIISICQKCPNQCMTCINHNKCFICQFSYYLFEGVCFHKCPFNYMYFSQTLQINNATSNLINFNVGVLTFGMNVSNNTCVQCASPCRTCTYSQVVCSSCIQNYYYYNSNCYLFCPDSTYFQKIKQQCVQCQFPCSQCYQNSTYVFCTKCLMGYYVQNNVCVNSCSQNLYINSKGIQCVGQCDNSEFYNIDFSNSRFCLSQCSFPFVKYIKNSSLMCMITCQSQDQYYVDSSGWCRLFQENSQKIPQISMSMFVSNRQILTITIQFKENVFYMFKQNLENILRITYENFYETDTNLIYESRLLQNNIQSSQIQQFLVVSQTQNEIIIAIFSDQDILPKTDISLTFINNTNFYIIDQITQIPVQANSYKFNMNAIFQQYSSQMLQNQFAVIGEVIVDFGLILAVFLLIFNLYSKIYTFLIVSQSIFMIALLQISLPPNLYQFLQGFKSSHLYQFGNWLAPNQNIFSYRQCMSRQHVISLYNDCSFIKVVGHTFNIYLGVIVIICCMLVSRFIFKCQNQIVKEIISVISQRIKIIKWSHINDLCFSLAMITICGFFIQTCTSFQASKSSQILSIFTSFALFLPIISYLIYFTYKNKKLLILSVENPRKFDSKRYLYRQDYVCYTDGINNPKFLFKNYLHIGRICLYGFMTGFIGNWPLLCLSVFLAAQLLSSFIYYFFAPYSDNRQNQIYTVSGVLHSIALFFVAIIQFQTYDPTKQTGTRSYNSDEIKQKKWILGYIVIILLLSVQFLLLLEIIISIIRGNMRKKRLSAQIQELQFNRDKLTKLMDSNNSPQSLVQKNIIYVQKSKNQQKKQFQGFQVEINEAISQQNHQGQKQSQTFQNNYAFKQAQGLRLKGT